MIRRCVTGRREKVFPFSVEDKIRIARRLDAFGMDYIEGGWPGAAPPKTPSSSRVCAAYPCATPRLAAFGSTRRAHISAEDDSQLRLLLEAETPSSLSSASRGTSR